MIKKIKLLTFLMLSMILFTNCSSDDDGNGETQNNPFIGVFTIDTYSCSSDTGSGSGGGLQITITASNSGNPNEIAIKNITGTNAVYSATVNGTGFTFDSNSDNITGSGNLQSDGNTIQYSYSNPNNDNEMCSGIATRN